MKGDNASSTMKKSFVIAARRVAVRVSRISRSKVEYFAPVATSIWVVQESLVQGSASS
jgi:hypothetical protein